MAVEPNARRRRPNADWRRVIDESLAKALGDSLRQQILWILNERSASPSEIAVELGETMNRVTYHLKVLKEAGCVEQIEERIRGNNIQRFYKATSRAFLDDTDWPRVPDTLKEGLRATLLQNILHDVVESVKEGTYDLYERSHMSWTPMLLDDQGRSEMADLLEKTLEEAIDIQGQTQERLESNGELGMSYTVSMMGYPAVGGMKRIGPPADARDLVVPAPISITRTTKASKQDPRR